ncbi:MAG: hypothetical protein JW808_05295, partial [Victivallales bacterium]|nr:hypothetical protein [Victivallales bacterium]
MESSSRVLILATVVASAATFTACKSSGSLEGAIDTVTYHVDNRAGNASDDNPGSYDEPFMTISKAAAVAGAGDTVKIRT